MEGKKMTAEWTLKVKLLLPCGTFAFQLSIAASVNPTPDPVPVFGLGPSPCPRMLLADSGKMVCLAIWARLEGVLPALSSSHVDSWPCYRNPTAALSKRWRQGGVSPFSTGFVL